MNYIIWNGVDSRSSQGLLIRELPPITRPKMRTQITEIDGKDGSFVDNLGYASYDKAVKIGLTQNYDVDEIAKYFTGSGQIIFSNDPDKYYNSQILEQIDFERFLKFKTATVKFYTQPFKYLVGEQPVECEINSETELIVTNQGLEYSKPEITMYGTGIVQILINGNGAFEVDLENDENTSFTVDSDIEECYSKFEANLKNRNMVGVFPTLKPGENTITWTGNLTNISIHPKSRWL